MLVRNKQYKLSEVQGRWTDAYDKECPCRSCYHPHDFGFTSQVKGYIIQMRCLTRELNGCPNVLPTPIHFYSKRGKVCKRCGKSLQTQAASSVCKQLKG